MLSSFHMYKHIVKQRKIFHILPWCTVQASKMPTCTYSIHRLGRSIVYNKCACEMLQLLTPFT